MNLQETELQDGDYILTDNAAWFTIKGFSVRIHDTNSGIAVNIYEFGREMDFPLDSAYASDSR
jgi:hypothetical protein